MINTAFLVMDELDFLWLPILKSRWLNERMYIGKNARYTKFAKDEYNQINWRERAQSHHNISQIWIFLWKQQIEAKANNRKRISIYKSRKYNPQSSNALCDTPDDKSIGLKIPNGLPLIYDIKSKCMKILERGTCKDPLEVYNFGNTEKYLFKPSKKEDVSSNEHVCI